MESYKTQQAKWAKQIEVFGKSIKALELAKTFADRFDGKVINKRFTNALNEASNQVFGNNEVVFGLKADGYNYTRKQNIVELVFSITDTRYNAGYIDYNKFIIFEIDKSSDSYINADGRLNKDIFIEAIDKQISNAKESIRNYQKCIDNFDNYLDRVKQLNKEIDDLKKDIPYPMSICTYKIDLPFWY